MDEIERKRAADRERQRAHRARKAAGEQGVRAARLKGRLALLEKAQEAVDALWDDYDEANPRPFAYRLGEEGVREVFEALDLLERLVDATREAIDPVWHAERKAWMAAEQARLDAQWEAWMAAEQARLDAEWEAEREARRAAEREVDNG